MPSFLTMATKANPMNLVRPQSLNMELKELKRRVAIAKARSELDDLEGGEQ